MTTTGGERLNEAIRQAQRQARAMDGLLVEVGFHGRMAGLASTHEYGLRRPGVRIPERPAFRVGARKLEGLANDFAAEDASGGMTYEKAVTYAIKARDIIRQSYHDFHGEPLSERQKARKEDTPFADEQLIGSRGPKLISHIHAYVNGERVDWD